MRIPLDQWEIATETASPRNDYVSRLPAFPPSRLPALPPQSSKHPVERRGERLLCSCVVGWWAAGDGAGEAGLLHEVAHREPLADGLTGVLLAAGIDHGDALGDQQ